VEMERQDFPAPTTANESLIGAVLWSSFVICQDSPTFVAVAIAGGLISTGCSIYRLFL
jgi:hypothetical protein